MPKLHNPFFSDEFRDYLIANDFKEADELSASRKILFYKEKIAIEVISNKIIVYEEYQDESSSQPVYAQTGNYEGLAGLRIFEFMLLMHITRAVTLNQLAKRAGQERAKTVNMWDTFGSMFNPSIAGL